MRCLTIISLLHVRLRSIIYIFTLQQFNSTVGNYRQCNLRLPHASRIITGELYTIYYVRMA